MSWFHALARRAPHVSTACDALPLPFDSVNNGFAHNQTHPPAAHCFALTTLLWHRLVRPRHPEGHTEAERRTPAASAVRRQKNLFGGGRTASTKPSPFLALIHWLLEAPRHRRAAAAGLATLTVDKTRAANHRSLITAPIRVCKPLRPCVDTATIREAKRSFPSDNNVCFQQAAAAAIVDARGTDKQTFRGSSTEEQAPSNAKGARAGCASQHRDFAINHIARFSVNECGGRFPRNCAFRHDFAA